MYACLQGAWNLQNQQFFAPAKLESFGVACFADARAVGGPSDNPLSLQVLPPGRCITLKHYCLCDCDRTLPQNLHPHWWFCMLLLGMVARSFHGCYFCAQLNAIGIIRQ